MLDFLTGFLLGIVFAIGLLVFGIYKLLLKEGEAQRPQLPNHASLSQMQYGKYIKHSIQKYTVDESRVDVETCSWINTIAAAVCVEALSSRVLVENLSIKLHEILNKPEDKPDILGKIVVSDINLGTSLPKIDGIKVVSRSSDDTLNAEVHLQYNGGASFTISTELWMNWPTPKFAALPVSLHASFDHFEGALMTSCYFSSPSRSRFTVFFQKPPIVQLRIGSTIGHSAKLVNVAQISALIENQLHKFVNTELVYPGGFEIEVVDGAVSAVRKLSDAIPATLSPPLSPTLAPLSPTLGAAQYAKITEKGERYAAAPRYPGDLSRRSFSVSAGES